MRELKALKEGEIQLLETLTGILLGGLWIHRFHGTKELAVPLLLRAGNVFNGFPISLGENFLGGTNVSV